ncbi:MAG: hypothetical protein ACOCUW_04295 [Gemmatimonadota bacterium]
MSLFERARVLGFGILAVTFIAGALAGAAIDRAVGDEGRDPSSRTERPDNDRRHHLLDEIDLSEAQEAAIDSILERRTRRMRAIWREFGPRLGAITDSAKIEIMDVLTAEQRAEYERKMEKRRRYDERDRNDRDPDSRKDTDAPPDGA